MSPRLKSLIIGAVVAAACALAIAALVTAVTPEASAVRHSALGANDPLGLVIHSLVVNILTS
ncbi:hypothetical protein GCM10010106_22120 [Thermopolyspora flexuosa]|jgi:hypothetical protein|uniref:Uncharacterized protein n=1 Tax=Thermopolyspora flexuosa TaxID=103836 RepID=A0A543J303_9ACTN|nr:hypothetical protein [Thermopolyspora flexuosa]TQM77211.1 hypothetical protein FHX40_3968 [Thermopolyspora flexuosa]GGM75195.1 hypothetical protein GCM10010106_22120 [Thermopolyspora flexuosa]